MMKDFEAQSQVASHWSVCKAGLSVKQVEAGSDGHQTMFQLQSTCYYPIAVYVCCVCSTPGFGAGGVTIDRE